MPASISPDLLATLYAYFVDKAAPASGITPSNISQWNSAYSWGNHALAGYASQSSVNFLMSKYPNWDTAYSWGNHASAGYAQVSQVNRSEQYTYTATGGETQITLPHTPLHLTVYFFASATSDGVVWRPTYRYTIAGATISFVTALSSGNIIIVDYARSL